MNAEKRIYDLLLETPLRRGMMGHFVEADFERIPLPYTFKSGWKADVIKEDGEKCFSVQKGDAVFALNLGENFRVSAAPFLMYGKLCLCACDINGAPVMEVSDQELYALTGMRRADVDEAPCIFCTLGDKDYAVLDASSEFVWIADRTEAVQLDIKSFALSVQSVSFSDENTMLSKRLFPGDVDYKDTMNFLSSSLSARAHAIKGDGISVNLARLLPDWAENTSGAFRIMDRDAMVLHILPSDDRAFNKKEPSGNRTMRKAAFALSHDLYLRTSSGQTLLKLQPEREVTARVARMENGTIYLLIKDKILPFSKPEFERITGRHFSEYEKFLPKETDVKVRLADGSILRGGNIVDCDALYVYVCSGKKLVNVPYSMFLRKESGNENK